MFHAIHSRLHSIISKTQLSCKFNTEEQQGRRDRSFWLSITTLNTSTGGRNHGEWFGGEEGSIGQSFCCISWLFFTLKKQKDTAQRWPSLLGFYQAAVGFSTLTGLFILDTSDGNVRLERSLRETFSANSFHLSQTQGVKSHHFHLYLSNIYSLNTNDQKTCETDISCLLRPSFLITCLLMVPCSTFR